jgi:hypothetical protein
VTTSTEGSNLFAINVLLAFSVSVIVIQNLQKKTRSSVKSLLTLTTLIIRTIAASLLVSFPQQVDVLNVSHISSIMRVMVSNPKALSKYET